MVYLAESMQFELVICIALQIRSSIKQMVRFEFKTPAEIEAILAAKNASN